MDVQSGRGLPKNFRQIGSAEKTTKVYIEDYVYTFMRKLSGEEDISIGALIGNKSIREGNECVFISGMVKAVGCVFADDRVIITDNTWAAVFENIKKYFDGMTVCGWFISSNNPQICSQAAVSGIYNCGNNESVLIYIRDRDSDEDFVYRITPQEKSLLSGYYIFYERNEPMQEYMVDTTGAKSVDPPPVNIMKRLDNSERKALEEADPKTSNGESLLIDAEGKKKKGNKTMYFAASLLLLSFLVLGYSLYQKKEGGTLGIPVFSNISSILKGGEETTQAQNNSVPDIIIENAEGIIVENSSETVGQSEISGEVNVSETINAESGTASENQEVVVETLENTIGEQIQFSTEALVDSATETAVVPVTEAALTVNTVSGSTYVVQAGDTLTSICIKSYGKEDPIKIEEIRNLNGLESADYIFVGQVLSMP